MSVEAKSYRPATEYTFPIPAGLQDELRYTSITARELLPSAEAKAISRSGNDGGVLVQEMVKECLVRATHIDGTVLEISTADDSVDRFMTEIGPKGRTLLMAMYNKVNQPEAAQVRDFLSQVTVAVR